MIRTLHHMAQPELALAQVRRVLEPRATFLLEYANKRNIKSILRHALGKQMWSPFTREAVEYIPLNFDFHPAAIKEWMNSAGFSIQRTLTVSHPAAGGGRFHPAAYRRTLPVDPQRVPARERFRGGCKSAGGCFLRLPGLHRAAAGHPSAHSLRQLRAAIPRH